MVVVPKVVVPNVVVPNVVVMSHSSASAVIDLILTNNGLKPTVYCGNTS